MICADEPRIRAIVREVIGAKDSQFVELKAPKEWEGNLYFKNGSQIFRFLYGRAQIAGCFDVRLDRSRSSRNFNEAVASYIHCSSWGYYGCRVVQGAPDSYSGNKKLDQWLVEIKQRAEGMSGGQ
jgi:hypothetical protein